LVLFIHNVDFKDDLQKVPLKRFPDGFFWIFEHKVSNMILKDTYK